MSSPTAPSSPGSHWVRESGRPSCVVVDAYSSGSALSARFRERGFRLLHVRSSDRITAPFLASYRAELFDRELVHDGDLRSLLAELRPEHPLAVVAGTETGVNLADLLSEGLEVPSNGGALTLARRNKYAMIEALKRAGLLTAKHVECSEVAAALRFAKEEAGFPVVLKPLESAGSDGVRICFDEAGIRQAFSSILGDRNRLGGENASVLAESFLEGTEYIVNTVSRDGEHLVTDFCLSTKRPSPAGDPIYDAITLLPTRGEIQDRLAAYFFRALDALGIRHGPAHGELMLTSAGPALIEVGARLAGVNLPVIFGACSTHSALDATIDAYTDPDRFRTLRHEGIVRTRAAKVVYLAAPESAEVQSEPPSAFFESLPSFVSLYWGRHRGQQMDVTQNLFSSPGFVVLSHRDEAMVERDYRRIRERYEAKLYQDVKRPMASFKPPLFSEAPEDAAPNSVLTLRRGFT